MSTVVTILWESKDFLLYFFLFSFSIFLFLILAFALFLILFLIYSIAKFYFIKKYKPRKFKFEKDFYILGHRGIPVLNHENTLASFELIKKYDIDGTEFDVNISKDKELFVYHDYNLFRLFGINKDLTEFSSQELKELKIKLFPQIIDNTATKNQNYENNNYDTNDKDKIENLVDEVNIPTLKDAFEKLKDCRLINLEIKSNSFKDLDLEKMVASLIKEFNLEKNIVISSFDPFSLYRFSKYLPEVPRGLLISKSGLPFYLKKLWFLPFSKADFIHYESAYIGTKLVQKLSKKGYTSVFWGVNSVQLFERALKENPLFIISDNPHILKKYYEITYIKD